MRTEANYHLTTGLFFIGLLVSSLELVAGQKQAVSAKKPDQVPIFQDSIVAIVGDQVITRLDVIARTWIEEQQLRRRYAKKDLNDPKVLDKLNQEMLAVRRKVAHALVEESVFFTILTRRGVRIPEGIILERMEKMIRKLAGGRRREFQKEFLAQGMTMAKLREHLRKQIIVDAFLQQIFANQIRISPSDIANYYNSHRQQYVVPGKLSLTIFNMISKTGTSPPNPRLSEISDWLKKTGVTRKIPDEFVTAFSKAFPEFKLTVLPMPNIREDSGDLRPEVLRELATMKPGTFSSIHQNTTSGSYWFFRLDKRQKTIEISFEQAYPEIEKTLRMKRFLEIKERYYRQMCYTVYRRLFF